MRERVAAIAALDEPVRRDLYFYVAGRPEEVGRDEAAGALGISRALAAFHLDKLVDAGLLEATFRRLSGRGGPGAGRPSKLYRRARGEIAVHLPERRYELAGQLLARALVEGGAATGIAALRRIARRWGEGLAAAAHARAGRGADRARLLQRAIDVLREAGFEPRRDGRGGVILRNCPFDALASGSRELICGMNHALIEGVVAGLRLRGVEARLEPEPGRCCVVLRCGEGRR